MNLTLYGAIIRLQTLPNMDTRINPNFPKQWQCLVIKISIKFTFSFLFHFLLQNLGDNISR